jgi:predicted dehydrogenase
VETVADFVQALRDERPFRVDGEHIRRATAAIEAAYESSDKGGVVVPAMQ